MRTTWLLLIVSVLTGASPATAASVSARSSPDVVYGPGDDVTYRLTVSADAGDETVVVISPMPLASEGPAAVKTLAVAAGSPAAPRCSDRSRPPHASAGPFYVSRWYYEVALHGGDTEVLTGHRHPRTAPWLEDVTHDLAPSFAIAPAFARPPSATVTAPAPRYAGPLGVRILLTGTTPGSPTHVSVRRGSSIILTGRVLAPLVGDSISLLARRPTETTPRLVARTRVRPDGTLAYRWRPVRAGRYRISAVYPSPRTGYLRTASDCSLSVVVRR